MSDPAPPAASRPPAVEHDAVEVTARTPSPRWRLRLFPDGLRLEPPLSATGAIHVLRAEAVERLDVVDVPGARRLLVVRKPGKRTFRLEPAAWTDTVRWLGRELRLRIALRKRVGLGIPFGVILLVIALPLPGLPFNPFNAALGVLILVTAVLARRRPHPALFLADSAFFAAMGASFGWRFAQGGSIYWALLALVNAYLVWRGVALFREFHAEGRS